MSLTKNPPLSIRIAMLIGLGFGLPLIATGLLPLVWGLLILISPNQLAESGLYGAGFTLLGGLFLAGGLVLIGIDLGLLWGMNGQSIIAYLMTLGLLVLGLWLDVPIIWGKPWWVGLGAQWFLSAGDSPHDISYWWHWIALGSSADVQVALIVCMVGLLLWPSTLSWFFGRDARRPQPPWKLRANR